MTLYTPHTTSAPAETCEIVAEMPDGRLKVELLRTYASGTVRTGQFRVYARHQLRADRGLQEIRDAVEALRNRAETEEEKLARQIRQTGRVPYDPNREESR